MKDVNKWFGDFQVLKDINLQVSPKQKIVVCGPSGSGKSTLIRCINRLEEHQKGKIVVDGIEQFQTDGDLFLFRVSGDLFEPGHAIGEALLVVHARAVAGEANHVGKAGDAVGDSVEHDVDGNLRVGDAPRWHGEILLDRATVHERALHQRDW